MVKEKKIMFIEKEIKVASYDIDLAGIVSNISYIRWLEDLRLLWLEKYFSLDKQIDAGFVPILLETNIEYHHAIRMFDQVKGLIWVGRLHSHKWRMKAAFVVKDRIMASAEQKGVFVDRNRWKPIRIPDQLRELYRQTKDTQNEEK